MRTSVNVHTHTETRSRKELIVDVLRFTKNFIGLPTMEEFIQSGVIDNHWICAFIVRSYNQEKEITQEIELNIDWATYELKIANSEKDILLDTRKGRVTQISDLYVQLLSMFKIAATKNRTWTTSLLVRYTPDMADAARKVLGTTPTDGSIPYAPGTAAIDASFGSLSELGATARVNNVPVPKGEAIEYVGVVEHKQPRFGFIRPDNWSEKRAFWFLCKDAPSISIGSRVRFIGFINESGRYEAKEIQSL